MLLRLLLMRHGKSSVADAPANDFERTLRSRGRLDTRLTGGCMSAQSLLPDCILCSSARRTRDTLAELLPFFSNDLSVTLTGDLYDAPMDTYLESIRAHGGRARTVLVIGHNPAIQETALELTGGGDPSLIARIEGKYPTGALTVLDFNIPDWAKLTPSGGEITGFLRPRDLDQTDAGQSSN